MAEREDGQDASLQHLESQNCRRGCANCCHSGALDRGGNDLEKRIGEIPKRKEVVAYCRGPYCLMSFDTVMKLRKRGLRAKRLENGLPEWRAAGLPVEH